MKYIISLCDYSGRFAQPWADNGYKVLLVDPKHPRGVTHKGNVRTYGMTARDFLAEHSLHFAYEEVEGILAAPPCTHFSVSGAQYWKAKDADGRTAEAVSIVKDCLTIIDRLNPHWFAIENPVGRLKTLVPRLQEMNHQWVQPHHFAELADDPETERYTKKTGLWGRFNPLDTETYSREPVRYCSQGSWLQQLGGSSERTKTLRSMTPTGLARAFYLAQQ